jgi:hypothetical protein
VSHGLWASVLALATAPNNAPPLEAQILKGVTSFAHGERR